VGRQRHAPAALPREKTRYPLYRRLVGPQGRDREVWKISPPPGFDSRTVQPVASRCTDLACSGTNEVFEATVRLNLLGRERTLTLAIEVDVILGDMQWNQQNGRDRLKLIDKNRLESAACRTVQTKTERPRTP
jgi:hypothetical protein